MSPDQESSVPSGVRTPPQRAYPTLPGTVSSNLSTPVDPNRLSSHPLISNDFTVLAIRPKIRNDLMDNFQEGVSIQDFVQHIWGFDPALLKPGSWTYEGERSLQEEYVRFCNEPGRYKPFCSMAIDAYKNASQHVTLPKHCNLKLVPLGEKLVHSDRTYRKPDAIVLGEGVEEPLDSTGRLLFRDVPLCMEFKKKKGTGSREDDEYMKRVDSMHTDSGATSIPSGKRKSESFPDGKPESKRAKTQTQSASTQPRKDKQLTADELQLARYALESLSDIGNRRYVTGIFVKEKTLSLWYFDRIGAIKSEELEFLLDPQLFVLVFAALHSCDSRHFGYEPLIHHPDRSGWPFSSVDGCTVTFPFYSLIDSPDAEVRDPISFSVTGKALHIQYGVVGRGTVVLPIRPVAGAAALGFEADGDLIAKFSWPVTTRAKEDELIRKIRKDVGPRWRRHITDLRLSLTIDDASEKLVFLPRTYLKDLQGPPPEERVLRILVSRRCERLRDARTLDEFKMIFLDIVRVHRIVYLKAGVLHRDLSAGNLMFNRDEEKLPYGILNDWDLGEPIATSSEPRTPTSRHRTGTLPFMAVDLLSDDPPRHIYRHDLESFLYILLWASVHYDLNGKERRLNPLFSKFTDGPWDTMADAKQGFLGRTSMTTFKKYVSDVTPAFAPLFSDWIEPLLSMFHAFAQIRATRAFAITNRPRAGDSWHWDEDTANNTVTYEKFMEALGQSTGL